jgi:hypothetical protein
MVSLGCLWGGWGVCVDNNNKKIKTQNVVVYLPFFVILPACYLSLSYIVPITDLSSFFVKIVDFLYEPLFPLYRQCVLVLFLKI